GFDQNVDFLVGPAVVVVATPGDEQRHDEPAAPDPKRLDRVREYFAGLPSKGLPYFNDKLIERAKSIRAEELIELVDAFQAAIGADATLQGKEFLRKLS